MLPIALLLLALCPSAALAEAGPIGAPLAIDSLVTFRWIGDRDEGAAISSASAWLESFEIDVPPGFEVKHWWYGEGLLTELRYADGTLIGLHWGGNMNLPDGSRPGAVELPSPSGRGRAFRGETDGKAWGAYVRTYGPASVWFDNAPPPRADALLRSLASVRYREDAG